MGKKSELLDYYATVGQEDRKRPKAKSLYTEINSQPRVGPVVRRGRRE